MNDANFTDAVLVVLGHGTDLNDQSAAPVFQHAAELRRRKIFQSVREGFWKQAPQIKPVLAELSAPRVFIAPLFIGEGYFSDQIIPEALGFGVSRIAYHALAAPKPGESGLAAPEPGESGLAAPEPGKSGLAAPEPGKSGLAAPKPGEGGPRAIYYCKPVGTHESMTKVILSRAAGVTAQFPFPRAPRPAETTLFIAGHGTERNPNSRKAVEHQAELIRALGIYAAVQAVFMEEDPRIAGCHALAQTKKCVVVPFFISDGLHVIEDIPVLLGEPERIVKARLAAGQPTWRNPTEIHGKLFWYSSSVGTDPALADVILERVREAAKRET